MPQTERGNLLNSHTIIYRYLLHCDPFLHALRKFYPRGLKREELIASNSMILHELYFDGLGSSGGIDDKLKQAFTHDFGSVDRWRTQFVAMGKALEDQVGCC